MNNGKLKEVCKEIKNIIINAGISIMNIYNRNKLNYFLQQHDTNSVIEAYNDSHNIICNGIKNIGLSAFIVSNFTNIPFEYRKNKMIWLIDPLDGKSDFLDNSGDFTINIALIFNNKPILGVVYIPFTKDLYWAYTNGGAWKSDNIGNIVKLKVAKCSIFDPGIRIVVSKCHNKETGNFINNLVYPQVTIVNSSLKLIMIACGNADIYPRFADSMEWETAAGHVLINEAGGCIKDTHNNDIVYNKETLTNPYFICYSKNS